jgi:hypothetical protein
MFPFGLPSVLPVLNLQKAGSTPLAQYMLMASYFSISKTVMMPKQASKEKILPHAWLNQTEAVAEGGTEIPKYGAPSDHPKSQPLLTVAAIKPSGQRHKDHLTDTETRRSN